MGALTSKPYAFSARPWELRQIESIDVGDSEGASIRVYLNGKNILRILPSYNSNLNLNWITDRTRFSYDANSYQRLDDILLSNFQKNFSWQKLNYKTYQNFFDDKIISNSIKCFVIGGLHINESTLQNYELHNANLGCSHLFFTDTHENFDCDADLVNYFTSTFDYKNLHKTDFILTIGLNLREQFPILYSRIRQNFFENGNGNFYQFGVNNNNGIFHNDSFGKNLGNDMNFLLKFVEGRSEITRKYLQAKYPLIFFGGIFLRHSNFLSVINLFFKNFNLMFSTSILRSNSLSISANYHGIGLDNDFRNIFKRSVILNKVASNKNEIKKIFYSLGNLEILNIDKSYDFIINKISHFDDSAKQHKKDCLLPAPTNFEQGLVHRNFFGQTQKSEPVLVNEKNLPVKKKKFIGLNLQTNFFEINLTGSKENLFQKPMLEKSFSNFLLANNSFNDSSNMSKRNYLKIKIYKHMSAFNGYSSNVTNDMSKHSITLKLQKEVLKSKVKNFF
jgi:hypothetical protein